MGISNEAYVAYGVYIPVRPYVYDESDLFVGEQVDIALGVPEVKSVCPDVGHLEAGSYDQNRFFLVTHCKSAELGKYHRLDQFTPYQLSSWNVQLSTALHVMGWDRLYPDLERPGWFVVADQS